MNLDFLDIEHVIAIPDIPPLKQNFILLVFHSIAINWGFSPHIICFLVVLEA